MAELKKGSKGKDVEELQKLLNKAGAKPPLKVDGIFGPITEGQVKAFQKKCKLSGDGKVGDTTMAAARYGGPLPEMTVDDYAKRLERFKVQEYYNANLIENYSEIGESAKVWAKAVEASLPKAVSAVKENEKLWVTVNANGRKIADIQAGFEKLRRRDPAKAADAVKECESLHAENAKIGNGKMRDNQMVINDVMHTIAGGFNDAVKIFEAHRDEIRRLDKKFGF